MSTPAPHAPVPASGSASPGQRLAADAAAAAEVRAYQTDPDVVALRVERARSQVDRLMWAGIALGLAFTMINVQQFAAAGGAVGSLAWWAAWLLDPMVSLVLLAVLRAEQITTRYQVQAGLWPRVAKWFTLAATYLMNTWSSWVAGSVSGVVLHSVAPMVVVIAAEAVTGLQHALTECVHRAHTTAQRGRTTAPQPRAALAEQAPPTAVTTGTPGHPTLAGSPGEHPPGGFTGRADERVSEHPVNPPAAVAGRAPGRAPRPAGEPRPRPVRRSPGRRKLLADYVAEARAAWAPGVIVTPAWARQVTGCSRGLSPKVAAALTTGHTPPYQHTPTTRSDTGGRAA